jgi:predicted nuclease of predicted toxin-antitoxin system
MDLVADESVDFGIITELRGKNFSVFSISEEKPGIPDQTVLEIAHTRESLLITEDKDFGELAYRLKYKHYGILLIRLSEMPRKERIQIVTNTIELHLSKMGNSFSVITQRGLRIKNIS